MKVLVACEFSGIVRDAFIKRGHDAWSCDLLPTESPGPHYQGDVFDIIGDGWGLMISHWPCTRLCNSSVRWLAERDLWADMRESAKQFRRLLDCGIPRIAAENPIPHKYARAIMGGYTQIIQPWQFGHPETKATCLWLRNLPNLVPTNIVAGREQRIWKMPPGPDRAKNRSRTFQGIADAMAEQWGSLIEKEALK